MFRLVETRLKEPVSVTLGVLEAIEPKFTLPAVIAVLRLTEPPTVEKNAWFDDELPQIDPDQFAEVVFHLPFPDPLFHMKFAA